MAHLIRMPKLSDDMQEGTLIKWFKDVGEPVDEGELLVEIETDKANMEVECYYPGHIMSLDVKEGQTVPIGTVIARIAESEEEMKQAAQAPPTNEIGAEAPAEEKADTVPKAEPAEGVMLEDEDRNFRARVPQQRPHLEVVERVGEAHKATPVAKRLADEHGISLLEVEGSGPGGRIVKADVERHIVEGKPKTAVEVPGLIQPLDQKRKYIVRKMVESKSTIPHYYLGVRVAMDEALALRRQYNDTHSARITITDFIIKASANSLKTFPLANAHYESDSIKFNEFINIAVAVDTGDILLAPVVKNCESLTLTELSNTSAVLIEKARNKKLMPEDYEGGTFYISNVGNLGIEDIAPIIFPTTSAILGVGAITKTPVVDEDDQIAIRRMMKIIISADHRVLDGARAAEFLMEIKKNLESPLNLLS